MPFSSPLFVFLFLPVFLGIYFVIRRDARNTLLVLGSLLFYVWGEKYVVLVMIASIIINYVLGLSMEKFQREQNLAHAKIILTLAIVLNIGMLVLYKYINPVIGSLSPLFAQLDISLHPIHSLKVPMGISFFTFHAISYVVDIYRGEVPAQRNPLGIALYISLFPKLLAGPIVRYRNLEKQFASRCVNLQSFGEGARRFALGLGKKLLIADILGARVDQIFLIPASHLSFETAWLGIFCYTLQIYYDFSGYTDMAIGIAKMLGFDFPENFNYPYISQSIREFWRRWHITLSQFFRDYLYIPLGGNRLGRIRLYLNLLAVFFLCGLWHGAGWGFVIWGIYHGFFIVLEHAGFDEVLEKIWRPLRHLYASAAVMVGWVFFRSETLPEALSYIQSLIGLNSSAVATYPISIYIDTRLLIVIIAGIVGAAPLIPAMERVLRHYLEESASEMRRVLLGVKDTLHLAFIAFVLVLSAMAMAGRTGSDFIYFQF